MVSSDPSSPCSTTCTSIYINNLSNCQCFVCFFLDSDLSAQTAGKVVAKMARQLLGPPTWSICVVNGDGVAVSNPTPSAGNCKRNELVRTHTHQVAQINERDKGLESGGVFGYPGVKGRHCPSGSWPTRQPDSQTRSRMRTAVLGAASSSTCVDILMTLTWHAVC